MGAASPLLWLAALFGAAGVAVLRYAWSLPKRSAVWNGGGWAFFVAAVFAGWASDGAWGVAFAALVTMAAAGVVLGVAGFRSPRGRARPSNRRVGLLPDGDEPRRIGRRIGTFLIVIGGGFVVSIGLAVALCGLGGALGWNEANTLVLALYAVPLGWAVLATVLLMLARRRSQIAALALCALPVAPFLLIGVG